MPLSGPLSLSLSGPLSTSLARASGRQVDPLAGLSRYLSLDASKGFTVLNTSGDPAGYMDDVQTITNLATGAQAASDPVQTTSASRGRYLPRLGGQGYIHFPGVSGNTVTVPLVTEPGDSVTVTTVPASAASEVTVDDTSDTVTIGPGSSYFYIKSLVVTVNGIDELDIDFTDESIPHMSDGGSFVCATGQTVQLNVSGNNPLTLLRKPCIRLDGVDDFYSGTFASAISGGRMFAVFDVLGDGGFIEARVFSTSDESSNSGGSTAGIDWSKKESVDLATKYSSTNELIFTGGFNGRIIHEVSVGSDFLARRNGTLVTSATNPNLSSTIYSIGVFINGGTPGGVTEAAIDLHALDLYALPMTDPQGDYRTSQLNSKWEVY